MGVLLVLFNDETAIFKHIHFIDGKRGTQMESEKEKLFFLIEKREKSVEWQTTNEPL